MMMLSFQWEYGSNSNANYIQIIADSELSRDKEPGKLLNSGMTDCDTRAIQLTVTATVIRIIPELRRSAKFRVR